MKTLLTRLLPLAALFLAGCATQPRPEPATTAAPRPAASAAPIAASTAANDNANPALWAVKDADTTIYLFGTVHVLKPGLTWFDGAVKTAFDGSGELVLEMVTPGTPDLLKIMTEKGFAKPNDPPLSASLPTEKREAYLNAMTAAGMPPQLSERVKPWLASVRLTMWMAEQSGYGEGVEPVLTKAATAAGKPVRGLETAEQQFGFFDGLSQEAQVKLLLDTMNELPKAPEMLGVLVDNWAAGDANKLGVSIKEQLGDGSTEVTETLFHKRNANWADWIKNRLAQPGTVFVAVGAGHLAGSESVQAMLAERGVKAKRVKY